MLTLRSLPAPATVTAALTLCLGLLVGCGGDGDGGGPTAPPPAPELDFSPIAGEWSGSATENNGFVFFVDATGP